MQLCASISWALLREPKLRVYLLFILRAQRRWLQSLFLAVNANCRLESGLHESNTVLLPKSGCLFGCDAERRLAGFPGSDYDNLWLVCPRETDDENRAMVNRAASGIAFGTLCSPAGRSTINS